MAGRHKQDRSVPARGRKGRALSVHTGVTADGEVFVQVAGGLIALLDAADAAKLSRHLIEDNELADRWSKTPKARP
ncbi:hypothetical protein [Crossiella sp. CA198]|uniref:hypothetical protein n=1 Tax=Crossiella sp. CA198 TaxID=3455607 RepID=UPI003F8CFD35